MKIYEIGTGYTPIPAKIAAATESVVEELSKAFLTMGIPVEIVDIYTDDRGECSIPINEVMVPDFFAKSDIGLGLVHKLKRVAYSIALASKLKRILALEKDKVVLHFHNQYNLFFFLKLTSKKRRANAVITYTNHNGLWSLPWEEVSRVLRRKYFQEIEAMKKADAVFVLNSNSKNNICENLSISGEKLFQINNGVNTEVYSPIEKDELAEFKEKYGLNNKKIILQVGSVYENKGQDRAIKLIEPILKKNKNIVYVYAGEIVSKEYFDKIQAEIQALGIDEQVVYLGSFSPGYEMNLLYNIADATILLSRYEGFPLVCVESLASGVPVIIQASLKSFDIPECICFDNTNELDDIINSIINGCNRDKEKVNLRNCALCEYSWYKIAERYLEIFKWYQ